MEPKLPLHVYQVHQSFATINKIHTLFFFISLLSLLYYRFSILFQRTTSQIPILPWLLITMSEFLLSLYWILAQAYRWRPVSRTVFTERLPNNEDLPPIDVFIFTCDPMKEPTVGVMNTVISALCIDYPPEKLFVYLSDDGGAPITLYATREAYNFAKKWAPFCKKYGIKTIAPEAYFSKLNDEEHPRLSSEFLENLEEIKSRYKVFKQLVEKAIQSDESCLSSRGNRSACIEVMRENATDEFLKNRVEIPHLVYVSREKRSNCHHKFKAGAINVLLRVSGIISNSPCILFLDCDMYCNDPMSARQAMCFHLDPQISSSLAFVQYPQTFHNVSKNDIYNTPMRTCMKILWPGLDGLMGPILSGTCFYMKRDALYKNSAQEDIDLFEGKKRFGPSDAFLASIYRNQKQIFIENEAASNTLIEEATVVASCTYEEHTKWGKQIGFLYKSVVEDVLTGMVMHCKGWISLYYNPSRPAFLGTGTTNLNASLIQTTRWYSGFLQISFSKFCPLVYQPFQMSILQTMAYLYLLFLPFTSFLVLCHSTIPQLCLFNGIKLYPKASEPWFAIFMIVYLSSLVQHLTETLFITGGSRKLFWNEQRISYFTRTIREEKLFVNHDQLNPLNLFGAKSDEWKAGFLPELKDYFTPKGGAAVVRAELGRRKKLTEQLMAHVRRQNETPSSRAILRSVGKVTDLPSPSQSLMPPSTVPKYVTSGKKRNHSGNVKVSSPPKLVSTPPSKALLNSDSRPGGKAHAGKGNKGKQVAEAFRPGPFVYLGPHQEQFEVLSSDSALSNPLVSRAVNEGVVLPADSASVVAMELNEVCSQINMGISSLNARFQGLRLVAEAGAVADLEAKQLKEKVNLLQSSLAIAEQSLREKEKELMGKDADAAFWREQFDQERARLIENHSAWETYANGLKSQLAELGSPEEGELQEAEDVPATPKEALDGPADGAVAPAE